MSFLYYYFAVAAFDLLVSAQINGVEAGSVMAINPAQKQCVNWPNTILGSLAWPARWVALYFIKQAKKQTIFDAAMSLGFSLTDAGKLMMQHEQQTQAISQSQGPRLK